ncbi:hypothetical protein CHARACLAT_006684 [Characodon lateralis]|uniref:Uncharacterized protein n=1 Tax=Characodon lateralis TaxID=208331 RepID=A0ABU7EHJ4_9TELE|nr:hypothetical protein [Characodon lateralis]
MLGVQNKNLFQGFIGPANSVPPSLPVSKALLVNISSKVFIFSEEQLLLGHSTIQTRFLVHIISGWPSGWFWYFSSDTIRSQRTRFTPLPSLLGTGADLLCETSYKHTLHS